MKSICKSACIGVVIGAAVPANAEPFSGPYIGIEGGIDSYDLSFDLDLGDVDSSLDGYRATFDGLSGDGGVAGLFLGYKASVGGKAFIALEGFGNLSGASISTSVSDGADTARVAVKSNESYGVAGKIGIRANRNTGVYARVGWLNTSFESELDDSVDVYSESETEDAIQFGGGIETMVARKMSLRLEYLRADYGDAGVGDGVSLHNNGVRAGIAMRF